MSSPPPALGTLFLARVATRSARPDLTDFRLLWQALSVNLAGRPKLIFDPRASGRRQLWLADPDAFGLRPAAMTPPDRDGPPIEPFD